MNVSANSASGRLAETRSTALFQLAIELPAAVLARTLGTDITVAVKWQRAAFGTWAAYTARSAAESPIPAGKDQTRHGPR
ncbi:hypothetical protein ACIQVR_37715 [Streptomyces xanthochromogenes]|uniref:hypothetical protein n=1 Tax=Streptomyces xanthochromogenes TaxID=67384 RepID=UPI0038014A68